MSLLAASATITRYRVEGDLPENAMELIRERLQHNRFPEIEDPAAEFMSGWTPFESHYDSDFAEQDVIYGTTIVFCLRIDKKSVPAKITKKHIALETRKRLLESGKEFLSKNEKKALKEDVVAQLLLRMPATPNLYDLIWHMEEKELWFFSGQKAANEELETLFSRSFGLRLMRLFPYTIAMKSAGLTEAQTDRFNTLSPTRFTE